MYSSNERIGKILNIKSEEVGTECALGEWFAKILNNVSIATNGALTFEVGIQTSAGITMATRRAAWVGNIHQEN